MKKLQLKKILEEIASLAGDLKSLAGDLKSLAGDVDSLVGALVVPQGDAESHRFAVAITRRCIQIMTEQLEYRKLTGMVQLLP
jgi:hypothetical protein